MLSDYQELISNSGDRFDINSETSTSQLAKQPQSTPLAPVFTKIINFLDGRDWTCDNYIKQSITDFKNTATPIEEIQVYLQFLEVQNHLETRGAGRNGLEAKKI